MGDIEHVLVVERRVFEMAGAFEGITFEPRRYLERFFSPGTLQFIPRPQAEVDPTYKQIIPYVLMTHGGRCLSYVRGRRAGEQRLVGQRSIGVGGHINPGDDLPLFATDLRDAYRAAVDREVAEEVVLESPHRERIVALLNDDSTEVGRVHLGIVHYWELERPDVSKREQVITQFGFLSPAELHAVRDSLESWSRMCLDNLDLLAPDGTVGMRWAP